MLKVNNITKKYRKKVILQNISFDLEKGTILGLLGPNGNGKTTILKIIANVLRNFEGEVTLDGKKIDHNTAASVAYLPDQEFLSDELKIKKAIEIYSSFYKDFDMSKAERLLKQLNLNENSRIKELSKGMKEKLYIILVLSRNAKLYLLDEPIAGVDIIVRKEILKLIVDNIGENSSAIITTHLINEIEKIFDKVCFIRDGKTTEVFEVEKLRVDASKSVEDYYIEFFKDSESN